MSEDTDYELDLSPLKALSKDLKEAAVTLSVDEARFLVDAYYQQQENRKRSANQVRSMDAEPHRILSWLESSSKRLEDTIKSVLGAYADSKPIGHWALSIYGIGPVISAGLLAHIDMAVAGPYAGRIWSFAGLVPNKPWLKGQKRPWNADLKTLCWKIGQSFMKFSNRPQCFYGPLYRGRKEYEWKQNLDGRLSEQATTALTLKDYDEKTDAWHWLSGCLTNDSARLYVQRLAEGEEGAKPVYGEAGSGQPMLPPAQIDARARRWVVKLFLSHYHHVAFVSLHDQPPPRPYVFDHRVGHEGYIAPPNWPME